MHNNIIFKLLAKIGIIIILIITQIITYKYSKSNPPEVKTKNIENGLSIKIYHGNKFVFFLNQYLIPIIIVIFTFCIHDIIYLLTDDKLNIFEKIISVILFLYITFILYIKIIAKNQIRKSIIFFGCFILCIGILIILIKLINK